MCEWQSVCVCVCVGACVRDAYQRKDACVTRPHYWHNHWSVSTWRSMLRDFTHKKGYSLKSPEWHTGCISDSYHSKCKHIYIFAASDWIRAPQYHSFDFNDNDKLELLVICWVHNYSTAATILYIIWKGHPPHWVTITILEYLNLI